jgi:flagella basal body P-ring formation protein FlgA
MRILLTFAMSCAAAQACHAVDGPNITGKDLAAADSVFAKVDPSAIFGFAPLPGVRRVMRFEELARMAAGVPTAEICFERATRSLSAEELMPVLRGALAIENAQVEILDFIRSGVPNGLLEFSRAGLNESGLWRGRVKYEENRTSPVWVKVRVTTEQTWIETTEPLVAGKPIDAAKLVLRIGRRFPFSIAPIASIDLAAGRIPHRAIKPGEPIFASMLAIPHEVERGAKVKVEVLSGEARVSFDTIAETSGRVGESVLIRNPETGRYFQARVEGQGKVVVNR